MLSIRHQGQDLVGAFVDTRACCVSVVQDVVVGPRTVGGDVHVDNVSGGIRQQLADRVRAFDEESPGSLPGSTTPQPGY